MSEPKMSKPCYCGCGDQTKSLFAVGHDARFKSTLATRLNEAKDNPNAIEAVLKVCDEVDLLSGREPGKWRGLVEKMAGNARVRALKQASSGRKPVTERQRHERKIRKQVREGVLDPDALNEDRGSYIDDLMDRLNRHPKVGQVGWLRLPEDKNNRLIAKVWKTARDQGEAMIWVKVVETGAMHHVSPECWMRDEELERAVAS